MGGARKSWREKLQDSKGLPRVETITPTMSSRWGTGTLVIPAPLEVDTMMKRVPKGKLTTINEIRQALAKKHKASIGCPLTTGIFAWIAAHAADEEEKAGRKKITPWWRTLKAGGNLNEKYPGGSAEQKRRLQAEGHAVVRKGRSRNWIVADFEDRLVCPGE
jgi:alkylated DNA nucleotide flippase Atl1